MPIGLHGAIHSPLRDFRFLQNIRRYGNKATVLCSLLLCLHRPCGSIWADLYMPIVPAVPDLSAAHVRWSCVWQTNERIWLFIIHLVLKSRRHVIGLAWGQVSIKHAINKASPAVGLRVNTPQARLVFKGLADVQLSQILPWLPKGEHKEPKLCEDLFSTVQNVHWDSSMLKNEEKRKTMHTSCMCALPLCTRT